MEYSPASDDVARYTSWVARLAGVNGDSRNRTAVRIVILPAFVPVTTPREARLGPGKLQEQRMPKPDGDSWRSVLRGSPFDVIDDENFDRHLLPILTRSR
jgi:hypothetical protein